MTPRFAARTIKAELQSERFEVASKRVLNYSKSVPTEFDLPQFVRAASGLTYWRRRFWMPQDDVRALGIVDLEPWYVEPLPLPRGPDGLRQHDDSRGTKMMKWDLESSFVFSDGQNEKLVALGSGSSPTRRVAVVVDPSLGVEVLDCGALFDFLATAIDGAELNIEASECAGERLYLGQRGNGRGRDGSGRAANLLFDCLRPTSLEAFTAGEIEDVVCWTLDLGDERGVPFATTDIVATDTGLLLIAVAEDSPDAIRDGEILGARVVELDLKNERALIYPVFEQGLPCCSKFEGIAQKDGIIWLVSDHDDPLLASDFSALTRRA